MAKKLEIDLEGLLSKLRTDEGKANFIYNLFRQGLTGIPLEFVNSAIGIHEEMGWYSKAAFVAEKAAESARRNERLELYLKAVKNYEKAGQFDLAGEVAERAGMIERAITNYERKGWFNIAAEAAERAGMIERAIEQWERAGSFKRAARFARRAGMTEMAEFYETLEELGGF